MINIREVHDLEYNKTEVKQLFHTEFTNKWVFCRYQQILEWFICSRNMLRSILLNYNMQCAPQVSSGAFPSIPAATIA